MENIKKYINEIGTPEIIQKDTGGEFVDNIIKNYLKENDIKNSELIFDGSELRYRGD